MEAFDGSFLDGAVHAFDLAIRPWMVDLREPVFDAILSASHVDHVDHVSRFWSVGIPRRIAELDAIVGEHCVHLEGHNLGPVARVWSCLAGRNALGGLGSGNWSGGSRFWKTAGSRWRRSE